MSLVFSQEFKDCHLQWEVGIQQPWVKTFNFQQGRQLASELLRWVDNDLT